MIRTGNWKILTETDRGSWFKQSLPLTTDQQPLASSVTVCWSPFLRKKKLKIISQWNSTKGLPKAKNVLLQVSWDSIGHLVSIGIAISSFLASWHKLASVVSKRSDMLVHRLPRYTPNSCLSLLGHRSQRLWITKKCSCKI